jgi:hypothetical protein
MRKLTKIILPEVEVGDLKIRPRGDNRCESAKSVVTALRAAELGPRYRTHRPIGARDSVRDVLFEEKSLWDP